MENKNTVIALSLMLLVWVGFTLLFPQQPQQIDENSANVETSDNNQTVNKVDSTVAAPVINNEFIAPILDLEQKNIVVENDKFIATFSNVGAAIVSFQLKQYTELNDPSSPIVSVVNNNDGIATFIASGNESLSISDNLIFATDSPEKIAVTDNSTITFTAVTSTGLVITKSYNFTKDDYSINSDIVLKNSSNNLLTGDFSIYMNTLWNDDMQGNRFDFIGPTTLIGEKIKTDDVDDIKEKSIEYVSDIKWTGFQNKYFMNAVVPISINNIHNLDIAYNKSIVQNILNFNHLSLNPGEAFTSQFQLYFGPKDVNQLKLAGHDLVKVVDFGFFELLAKPLHTVLNFFYGFIGNYGVAIILLTIILKLIFWPLTQKSYVSMRAMQTLQPEMKKLREKYSGDKETLNKKMMELYKEHRVNPMGGCLPMLVQIPVFFALYKVLLSTIELRHAPFVFWITDLSIKDPYYITPVIMGLTMFIQQKLTPSTMDPMQAKLMMAMPLVFTFMFLNFPAGLVIYWLVNNLLTIFQQFLIYRKTE